MLRLSPLFLLVGLWLDALTAQDTVPGGSFSAAFGIAVDSIHGGPLPGAIVRIDNTDLQATTDVKGYYRIDSVPPGTYRVSLHHPILDTLGTEIGTQPIEFPAGRVPIIPLGIPSDTTMIDIACPKIANAAGPAALLGLVHDPDTKAPAIGATVTLSWVELHVSKATGVTRERRERTVTVDSAGNYAICGLPIDFTGVVQATYKGASTAPVDIPISEVSLVTLRSLGLGASESVVDTSNGVVRRVRRGPASLRGRVLGPDGGPIAGARVEVPGTREVTVTTPSGNFGLIGLPAGTQAVQVVSVGFNPVTTIVELSAKRTEDVTVNLSKIQVIAPLESEQASTGLGRVGFTDRRQLGAGRFLTRQQIVEKNAISFTDIFRDMPGVRLGMDRNGNQVLMSTRGGSDARCVTAYVDRVHLRPPRSDQFVSYLNLMVRPEQVQAVEVYQASQVPGEFTVAGEQCLTIVVWTDAALGERDERRSSE